MRRWIAATAVCSLALGASAATPTAGGDLTAGEAPHASRVLQLEDARAATFPAAEIIGRTPADAREGVALHLAAPEMFPAPPVNLVLDAQGRLADVRRQLPDFISPVLASPNAVDDVDGDGTVDVLAADPEVLFMLSGRDGRQLWRADNDLAALGWSPLLDNAGRVSHLLGAALEFAPSVPRPCVVTTSPETCTWEFEATVNFQLRQAATGAVTWTGSNRYWSRTSETQDGDERTSHMAAETFFLDITHGPSGIEMVVADHAFDGSQTWNQATYEQSRSSTGEARADLYGMDGTPLAVWSASLGFGQLDIEPHLDGWATMVRTEPDDTWTCLGVCVDEELTPTVTVEARDARLGNPRWSFTAEAPDAADVLSRHDADGDGVTDLILDTIDLESPALLDILGLAPADPQENATEDPLFFVHAMTVLHGATGNVHFSTPGLHRGLPHALTSEGLFALIDVGHMRNDSPEAQLGLQPPWSSQRAVFLDLVDAKTGEHLRTVVTPIGEEQPDGQSSFTFSYIGGSDHDGDEIPEVSTIEVGENFEDNTAYVISPRAGVALVTLDDEDTGFIIPASFLGDPDIDADGQPDLWHYRRSGEARDLLLSPQSDDFFGQPVPATDIDDLDGLPGSDTIDAEAGALEARNGRTGRIIWRVELQR